MIYQVSAGNLHRFGPQLDQMFAFRLSAAAPPVTDARDDDLAIYLMEIDDSGDLSGALRLHPGSGPEPRWCADRWLAHDDSCLARLVKGVFDFCEAHSPEGVRIAGDASLLRKLAALGCRLTPSGPDEWEMHAGTADTAAVKSRADLGNLSRLHRKRGRIAARS